MGGVGSRPSGYVSDHPRGLAVDFMIPAWNTRAGNAHGWEVAHWLQAHAKGLHVKYLIFDNREDAGQLSARPRTMASWWIRS